MPDGDRARPSCAWLPDHHLRLQKTLNLNSIDYKTKTYLNKELVLLCLEKLKEITDQQANLLEEKNNEVKEIRTQLEKTVKLNEKLTENFQQAEQKFKDQYNKEKEETSLQI